MFLLINESKLVSARIFYAAKFQGEKAKYFIFIL